MPKNIMFYSYIAQEIMVLMLMRTYYPSDVVMTAKKYAITSSM
jgi:hypothetical protein